MGPSRVNPRTGQILDADIIFDADFLRFWRREYETFTPQSIALLTGAGPGRHDGHCCGACAVFDGHARETALAATALAAGGEKGLSEADREKLVTQGLKLIAMHEVGHTLGLRHNFKGSAYRSLADINDVAKTRAAGASTSVMDYVPVNIVPKGKPQGDYYTAVLGPYDHWAIEYGYRPIAAGSPEAELPELGKIAGRSGDPALAYATDEETGQRSAGVRADPGGAGGTADAGHRRPHDGGGEERPPGRVRAGAAGVRRPALRPRPGDVHRLAAHRRPVHVAEPQGRRRRAGAVPRRRAAAAAGGVDAPGKPGVQRRAVHVPAGALQPARGHELDALGQQAARPRGLPRARHDPHVAGQGARAAARSAHARPAPRRRAQGAGRRGCLHHGGAARPPDEGDHGGGGRDRSGRLHAAEAGDRQPASRTAAALRRPAVRAGDGSRCVVTRCAGDRRRPAAGARAADRHAPGPKRRHARRLLVGPSRRDAGADPQGARRTAGTVHAVTAGRRRRGGWTASSAPRRIARLAVHTSMPADRGERVIEIV
ncbi:MAG: hypothetical protein EBX36_06725 [Planctomycetia bacterium]|nr:hypothetical protein [Planctomycetia bacterium]